MRFELQVCTLYRNEKEAPEYIFVAAAALYSLTGVAAYRTDADSMWPEFATYQVFLYNWNNVVMQGIVILTTAPEAPGAERSIEFYRDFMNKGVSMWSECSNHGVSIFNNHKYCECAPSPVEKGMYIL